MRKAALFTKTAAILAAVSLSAIPIAPGEARAAQARQKPPASGDLSGEWSLATTCGANGWTANLNLTQTADGSLDAKSPNGTLTMVKPGGAFGSKMKSELVGNKMTLALRLKEAISVLELTGTVTGSTIKGRIHHYTADDCDFTMIR